MEEIGATNPEYQPMRFYGIIHAPILKKPSLGAHSLVIIKQIVSSLYQESSFTQTLLISMTWRCHRRFINSSLPSKTFLCACHFFFKFYFHFHRTLFVGLWELVSALLQCVLYLSYYFQPEVNTWMYLSKANTLQTESYCNLDPRQMICKSYQIHNLYWCIIL